MEFIQTFDESILLFIQNYLRTPALDFLMPIITTLGNAGIVWIFLAVVLIITKKYRFCGFAMALALLLSYLVGNLTLKPLIARTRPFEINQTIELLISKPLDFSFPSGHTMASFAGATVIVMYSKKAGIFAFLLAVLIAFSRLYLFVHYPSDVVAGAVIGSALAVLSVLYVKKVWKKT